VCGTIDIEKALTEGVKAFEPGLLAKANRGILYVDEVRERVFSSFLFFPFLSFFSFSFLLSFKNGVPYCGREGGCWGLRERAGEAVVETGTSAVVRQEVVWCLHALNT
jgi:hypothetical protein